MSKMLSVAAAMLVLAPSAASAMDWGSFYAEVYGGWQLPGTSDYYNSPTYYDMDAGTTAGISFGVAATDNVDVGVDFMSTGATYVGQTYTLSSLSAMGTVEVSMPVADMFEIYGGAGAGIIRLAFDDGPADHREGYGFGFQASAGARAHVTDNLSLFTEVKYQDSFGRIQLSDGELAHQATTHVLVGLRVSMD